MSTPGQQPTPPCGSKVQPDELINCTVCPSKTFKARNGRGICKPCLACGRRETVSSCTASKNAQCGDCSRGTFRLGFRVDSCKQRSTCCATKCFAEVECHYLRQCLRTNCTKEIENERYNKIGSKFSQVYPAHENGSSKPNATSRCFYQYQF